MTQNKQWLNTFALTLMWNCYNVSAETIVDWKDFASSLWNPRGVKPIFHVSSGFEPCGWQQQSQRSLSFVQLCICALTQGRATRAMLMGTKWGVSPWWITEGEGKHVFSCIHMETPLFFLLSPFFKSNKWSLQCLLFARILDKNSLCLDKLFQSLNVSQIE